MRVGPRRALLPASGFWEVTRQNVVQAGCDPSDVWRPASSSPRLAVSTSRLTTLGTTTSATPLEIRSLTSEPRFAVLPAAGSVPIAWPAGIVSEAAEDGVGRSPADVRSPVAAAFV